MNSLECDHFYYKELRKLAKNFYDDLTSKLYEKEVIFTDEYIKYQNEIADENNNHLTSLGIIRGVNDEDYEFYDYISTDIVMEIIDFKDYGADGIYLEVQNMSTGECNWIQMNCVKLKEE